jgi:DNA-3-methyladenine glycosylase II
MDEEARRFRIGVEGAYSLGASARFLCGFAPAGGSAATLDDGRLVLGFLEEQGWEPVTVALSQRGAAIEGEVVGGDVGIVRPQVARIFSLDHDARGFARVAEQDPVVGRALEDAPGFRPVCFPSAYEAAVWGVLAQRIPMAVAARVKQRLAVATGTLARGFGRTFYPSPPPERLLAIQSLAGVPEDKLARLRAVAAATLEGRLCATRLRAMPREEAEAGLREIRGIGAWTAEHVVIRGCGTVDEMPATEPRVLRAIAQAYGLDRTPSFDEATVIAERWRPFRTWISVLLVMHLRATARWNGPEPRGRTSGRTHRASAPT